MAVPVVVVQGLPSAPSAAERRAALGACSEALKHRSCVSDDDPRRDATTPVATAVISWPDGSDRRVRVTLDRFDASSGPLNRDIHFAEEDPAIERWRAIGLVVAALMGESDTLRGDAAESEPRPFTGAAGGPALPAWWFGLSALIGPGLDDGTVRLGGALHGALALRPSPFFLRASASHALRPLDDRGLGVRWTTLGVGAGAGARVPSLDLGWRIHLEAMCEYLVAEGPGATLSGGGSRLSPGLRGGADVRWPASQAWGATLGFAMWSLPGGTAIQLDQRKLGSSQWLSYAALLGAEWSFR
jgi:hypothetical protein